jgi:hypothetical protein
LINGGMTNEIASPVKIKMIRIDINAAKDLLIFFFSRKTINGLSK